MEPGKIFVGGISWETNEDRLRDYFQTFGDVVQALIIKDRATGWARGFGFVVYAGPAVADRVVRQHHIIDGAIVEAKKAVPRDDQNMLIRNHVSPIGSPLPLLRTKKIFVGGLASTVTEGDFKRYFDQFGTITDVVVMYDHNTQRPRGFGFITFESEEAVEKALFQTFHEIHCKKVEVKRAVPKEMSPGPTRSALCGGSGFSRVNSFLNGYLPEYNSSHTAGYGVKIDERQNPMSFARIGFPNISPFESRMNPNFNEHVNFLPKPAFEQGKSAYNGNVNGKRDFFAEFGGTNDDSGSTLGTSWSLWGNKSIIDHPFSKNIGSLGFRGGDTKEDVFKSSEPLWNSSPISVLSNGSNDNLGTKPPTLSSISSLGGGFDAKFFDFDSFEFGNGNGVSDVPVNNPAGLCW